MNKTIDYNYLWIGMTKNTKWKQQWLYMIATLHNHMN